jgi:hypothetical protein
LNLLTARVKHRPESTIVAGDHMRTSFLIFLALFTALAVAQEDKSKEGIEREKRFQEEAKKAQDTTKGWTLKSATGANLSQVALSNWAAGGSNSLAYQLWGTGMALHVSDQTRWLNSLKLMYGQTKLGEDEIRKTDDEIYFESLLIYLIGTTINPYASVTLRTQFAPGYEYFDDAPKLQISQFFDPAYLTQSVGLAYTPTPIFTTRLGVGAREVITSTYTQYADDHETPEIEKTRIQGGLESVSDLRWPFAENMVLMMRLELFAPFSEMDRIIVRNDNTIAMKVNEYITANINLQLINDVNITPKTQAKESISVGLSYSIL